MSAARFIAKSMEIDDDSVRFAERLDSVFASAASLAQSHYQDQQKALLSYIPVATDSASVTYAGYQASIDNTVKIYTQIWDETIKAAELVTAALPELHKRALMEKKPNYEHMMPSLPLFRYGDEVIDIDLPDDDTVDGDPEFLIVPDYIERLIEDGRVYPDGRTAMNGLDDILDLLIMLVPKVSARYLAAMFLRPDKKPYSLRTAEDALAKAKKTQKA